MSIIERWLRRIGDVLTSTVRESQDRAVGTIANLSTQVETLQAGINDLRDREKRLAGELATTRKNLERAMVEAANGQARMERNVDGLRLVAAEPEIARIRQVGDGVPLADTEISVFSQMGEDGIIQYILSRIEVPHKTFVEFGVTNYQEANTRLLLLHDDWSGLVMDCDDACVAEIQRDEVCWRYGLDAKCAFVTRDNINELIRSSGLDPDLGLLSIDVDGNDYWIWKAIDVVRPRVVVCEYNSVFGSEHPITIPYQEDFFRTKAHPSNLYFGCSLPALCRLAEEKGYHFIGSNRAGVNAFFVRDDLSGPFTVLDAKTGYVESALRESRAEDGSLTFLGGEDRIREIQDCDVVHLDRDEQVPIRDLLS